MWKLKVRRNISAVEASPEEWDIPAPHQAPQPRVPVQRKEVPTTAGCENQQRLWLKWRAAGVPDIPLKRPAHRLTRWQTHLIWELQCWGSSNHGSIKIGGPTQPTKGTQLQQLAQVTIDSVPLGPTGYLLHKVTVLKQGHIAALPNT